MSYTYQIKRQGLAFIIPLILLALAAVVALGVSAYVYKSAHDGNANETATSSNESKVEKFFNFVSSSTENIFDRNNNKQTTEQAPAITKEDSGQRAVVTLAGGCFWCIEAFFQEAPGVVSAVSGYAGGTADTATYKQVSSGTTGHREAVQVTFDPTRISVNDILDIFWSHFDPTDAGGQFVDRGTQYTTAIFYQTDEQKQLAEASKSALGKSGVFNAAIVTKILPLNTFYPAEEYHQDYYKKSAEHYEQYKNASGRVGFIKENWAKQAALDFLDGKQTAAPTPAPVVTTYQPRTFSAAEIEAGLKKLSPEAYKVVAEEDTELPFKNAYFNNEAPGIYVDVVTGRPLFSSTNKYDSGTGWPSFYQALDGANLTLKTDTFLGFERTEVRSEAGHLGHVFDDGPVEHGGKRYCMNSLALRFIPKAEMEKQGYGTYLNLF